jgi:guanylate kinase
MSVNPVVIAGPSGVGKGTLVKMLLDKYPACFGFSVSHTTRGPRPGEVDGVHYNFVDKVSMLAAIERGEFIEHANVHTNIYGTSTAAVNKVSEQGKVCILDIDIQGVQSVKRSTLTCKYLFIAPPSEADLEKRLRGRGTETEDKIAIRLKNAIEELEFGRTEGNFDQIVINDDLNVCFDNIVTIIKRWFPDLPYNDV